MGLFDQVIGQAASSLLGGNQQGGASGMAIQAVMGLLQNQQGGLAGLVSSLAGSGLQQQVQSWVGTGANMEVEPNALSSALGSGVVSNIASQLGVDPNQASGILAQVLPMVIDKLTPNGQVEGNNDLMQQGMSALSGLFANK